MVTVPMVSCSFCGVCVCCCWPGHGNPAQRKVANRASLTDVGAHVFVLVTDEAEEIDDAREERDELSETIDSGDDEDEDPDVDWTDGRRLDSWYASRPLNLVFQLQSITDLAIEVFCACDIAVHIDDRLDP